MHYKDCISMKESPLDRINPHSLKDTLLISDTNQRYSLNTELSCKSYNSLDKRCMRFRFDRSLKDRIGNILHFKIKLLEHIRFGKLQS